jgi:predicted dehydrogenase
MACALGATTLGVTASQSLHAQSGVSLVDSEADNTDSVTSPLSSHPLKGKIELAPPKLQPDKLQLPTPVDRKIGYAIVGLGELSVQQILPAFAQCKHARCAALVSGHPDKAAKLAGYYGVPKEAIYSYDNYDRMADNDRIDVVYVVLPNSMHAEYTIRALKAGKHVLCEKPMATTVDECMQMIAAAEHTSRRLMIAYRLHYEPMNMQVMQWCREKKFGPVHAFTSSNSQNVEAPNIRLSHALGGGPLGDIGIYSINAARYIAGEEPTHVIAVADYAPDDPRFAEVPASVAFTLHFPSGVLAACTSSFNSAVKRTYQVHCKSGTIEMDSAFAYDGLKLFTEDGNGRVEHAFGQINHFTAEMDHFAQCIKENKDSSTPGSEGLHDVKVITALNDALRTGKKVAV